MKLFTTLTKMFETHAKYRTLNILRNMSDKQLVDIGISTELLREGIAGWPWQVPSEDSPVSRIPVELASIKVDTISQIDSSSEVVEKTAA